MNKTILATILGIFVIGMFSLVIAAADDSAADKAKPLSVNNTNMTVGQCVAAAAAVKNTCFATVKDARTTCRTDALNQTEPKPALKTCAATFKKDLKQCKLDFRADKKDCRVLKPKKA